MSELISRFTALPAYGIGALIVLLLYALQSEIRFGSRARRMRAGKSDRNSTLIVSASSAVPVLGFVLTMKASSPAFFPKLLPQWFRHAFMSKPCSHPVQEVRSNQAAVAVSQECGMEIQDL
jgi:hypothetical protein